MTIIALGSGFNGPGSFFDKKNTVNETVYMDSRDKVKVNVYTDSNTYQAGSEGLIAVVLTHSTHWHTHTNDPNVPKELGDASSYVATKLYLESSEFITTFGDYIQWPEPTKVKVGFTGIKVDYEVFEKETTLFLPFKISQNIPKEKLSDSHFIKIKTVFQACDKTRCLRPTPRPPSEGGDQTSWEQYGELININLKKTTGAAQVNKENNLIDWSIFDANVWNKILQKDRIQKAIKFDVYGFSFSITNNSILEFILILIVAGIGGFLLNLTPCVLPVIPLKIMSMQHEGKTRFKTFMIGFWTSTGLIIFWTSLGLAIASLTAVSATNELFQYPTVNIGIGLFLAIMAIGMCGVFNIKLPQFLYKFNPTHDSFIGSIGFGVMAGILATPCTAPFMGSAAAWAVTQSSPVTLLTFASIGTGMATPYLFLAIFPKFIGQIPKSGPGSELIKQTMGLFMLAAASYFIGVGLVTILATEGEPLSKNYLWLTSAIVASAGLWFTARSYFVTQKLVARFLGIFLGLSIAISALFIGSKLTNKGPINWVYFTPEKFKQAQDANKVIALEFTAEWCLNCKLQEENILKDNNVIPYLNNKKVAAIKADIGASNLAQEKLNEIGGIRIPLLVIYDSNGKELLRHDFYNENQVITAFQKAGITLSSEDLLD